MPGRDRTLDEFFDGDQESDDSSEDAANQADDAGTPAEDSDPVTPSGDGAVDPAEATYRWTGDGARCDGCGSHVERLWRDEVGLVCGDCKEW